MLSIQMDNGNVYGARFVCIGVFDTAAAAATASVGVELYLRSIFQHWIGMRVYADFDFLFFFRSFCSDLFHF